jgi:hypothetical protein
MIELNTCKKFLLYLIRFVVVVLLLALLIDIFSVKHVYRAIYDPDEEVFNLYVNTSTVNYCDLPIQPYLYPLSMNGTVLIAPGSGEKVSELLESVFRISTGCTPNIITSVCPLPHLRQHMLYIKVNKRDEIPKNYHPSHVIYYFDTPVNDFLEYKQGLGLGTFYSSKIIYHFLENWSYELILSGYKRNETTLFLDGSKMTSEDIVASVYNFLPYKLPDLSLLTKCMKKIVKDKVNCEKFKKKHSELDLGDC